ncbi:MAG: hypothetical protein L6437_08010, partial [Kiritimatiellae bacterium]|nr:hypothetical protein [Kiritimatiellia bacterium]
MRLIRLMIGLVVLFALNDAYSAVNITEGKNAEGKPVVLMENAVMKLTIDPSQGGRVSSFIWKATGADWVLPGNTGFFMDHVWQQTWPGELLGKEYEVKILGKGPERGVIQAIATINGKGDKAIEGVRLIRTMEIFKDSPRIEVAFRLENPTSEPRAPGLWVQNCIHVGGKATEAVWTYRPSTRGVIAASLDPETDQIIGKEHSFIYDPVAGWSAEVNPAGKEGVVFLMDYNWLRCLYNNGGSRSVEWWYDQENLGAGKSFETKVIMWPFSGLTGVSYASPELVADLNITVTGKELSL